MTDLIKDIQSDILSIQEMILIASQYGESIDLSNLDTKLHEMYLKLDELEKKSKHDKLAFDGLQEQYIEAHQERVKLRDKLKSLEVIE